MKRPEWRSRWKRAVYARHAGFTLPDGTAVAPLSDGTRVLLLRLLEDMDAGGYVSVPRSRLADDLGVPPARITERIKQATQHGLLYPVRAARLGRSWAVYQAVFPARRGTSAVPLTDSVEVRPPVPLTGTPAVSVEATERAGLPDLEVRLGIPMCRETSARSVPSPEGLVVHWLDPSGAVVQIAVDQLGDGGNEEEERSA